MVRSKESAARTGSAMTENRKSIAMVTDNFFISQPPRKKRSRELEHG
jgi:hypothetical protein